MPKAYLWHTIIHIRLNLIRIIVLLLKEEKQTFQKTYNLHFYICKETLSHAVSSQATHLSISMEINFGKLQEFITLHICDNLN